MFKKLVLLIVIILGVGATYLWINRAEILANRLSQSTGLPIQISTLSPSWNGLSLSGVKVIDKDTRTELDIAEANLEFPIRTLFNKVVYIKSVELSDVTLRSDLINISLDQPETLLNITNLFKKKKSHGPATKSSEKSFVIKTVTIHNLHASMTNPFSKDQPITLKTSKFVIDDFSHGEPLDLSHLIQQLIRALQK